MDLAGNELSGEPFSVNVLRPFESSVNLMQLYMKGNFLREVNLTWSMPFASLQTLDFSDNNAKVFGVSE